jgi:hypothetical protein
VQTFDGIVQDFRVWKRERDKGPVTYKDLRQLKEKYLKERNVKRTLVKMSEDKSSYDPEGLKHAWKKIFKECLYWYDSVDGNYAGSFDWIFDSLFNGSVKQFGYDVLNWHDEKSNAVGRRFKKEWHDFWDTHKGIWNRRSESKNFDPQQAQMFDDAYAAYGALSSGRRSDGGERLWHAIHVAMYDNNMRDLNELAPKYEGKPEWDNLLKIFQPGATKAANKVASKELRFNKFKQMFDNTYAGKDGHDAEFTERTLESLKRDAKRMQLRWRLKKPEYADNPDEIISNDSGWEGLSAKHWKQLLSITI